MFITIEGGEGVGKSTLTQKIAEDLKSRGIDVLATREPGGTALGDIIRNILLDPGSLAKVGKRAELLLFLAARAQHIEEVILPALRVGKIVLCDRFNDSTVAYQGAARTIGVDDTQEICDLVCDGLVPDLTLYLDLDPEIGLSRTKPSDSFAMPDDVDRIESEKLSFHKKVRQGFHEIARQDLERFRIIDASSPIDIVLKDAMKEIDERLSVL
ncbi:MAG: dTMP kinase [Waddliaceae bacterium]